MTTERLYLCDSFLFDFDATVLACTEAPPHDGCARWRVELDRSAFFPNKGGQPCDVGTLNDANVLGCDEDGDALVHLTDRPLPVGAKLRGLVDGVRRFDIMQQHTGEHLLSYCAYKLYGAANVGFHCALDHATLDLDKPLDAAELKRMEQYANRLAAEDAAVTATIYEREEDLVGLPLRKHAEGISAPIRIVRIEGSDCCTCCAPHVRSTGQIGQLFLTDATSWKGGLRVSFVCGERALKQARAEHDALDGLARRFSVSRLDAETAVQKQTDALADVKRRLNRCSERVEGYLAKELIEGAVDVRGRRLIAAELCEVEPSRLRALALATVGKRGMSLLFVASEAGTQYALAVNGLKSDAGELLAPVNAALNGKGGGRGGLAQGSSRSAVGLADAVEQLRGYYEKRLAEE